MRPRTVSQNRPRLRPPCFVATDYTGGSGASSRKRHCGCTVYAPPSLPRSAGTGRSAPCDVAQFDIRSATCQIEVEYGVVGLTHGVQNVRGHAAGGSDRRLASGCRPSCGCARQASLPRIASDRSRPDRSRGNTPPSPYVLRVIAAMPSSSHSSASSPAYEAKHLHMRSEDGPSPSLSMTRSSQSKSKWSSMGWRRSSAEDGKGHGVDAGLAHQADVVIPDFPPAIGRDYSRHRKRCRVRPRSAVFGHAKSRHARTVISLWQATQGHGPYRIPADTS